MIKFKRVGFVVLLVAACLFAASLALGQTATKPSEEKIVQAQAVLTVSESKRLIAKAVAQMPIVTEALTSGMVIIAKGTTNTYVAEEIIGKKIAHGALVSGRVYPAKGGKRLPRTQPVREVVLVKGELQEDLSLAEAVKQLKGGDVVIKGANVLDYLSKTAGVLIGAPDSGTVGRFMPYVVARKAHLVIPVGLEKQVAGNVVEIANKMRQPIESVNWVPSMFLVTGQIVTEIEALKILTGVTAFQAGAGGIGGAEGSVRLVFRGPKSKVEKALKLIEEVQGEPPFVK